MGSREKIFAFYKETYSKKEIAAYWDGLKAAKKKKDGGEEAAVAKAKPNRKAEVEAKWKVRKVTKEVAVGAKIPNVNLFKGFEKVALATMIAEKKVVITGVPGAFTPTCEEHHAPSFLKAESELKAKGIDEVIIMSVSDGAVMAGWKKALGAKEDSMFTFLGDPYMI